MQHRLFHRIDGKDDLLAIEIIRADQAGDNQIAMFVGFDGDRVCDAPVANDPGRQRACRLRDLILFGPMHVALDVLQSDIGSGRDAKADARGRGRAFGYRIRDTGAGDTRDVGRGGCQE
jgi:hypothetical protein